MDPYLITMTVSERVEADPNAVTRACVDAQNMKATLWLLGTTGSRRQLQGEQVTRFLPDQYMAAAKAGLLYVQRTDPRWAFCAGFDMQTGAPSLMEKYDDAFARRSYAGTAKISETPTLDLKN